MYSPLPHLRSPPLCVEGPSFLGMQFRSLLGLHSESMFAGKLARRQQYTYYTSRCSQCSARLPRRVLRVPLSLQTSGSAAGPST